jgi:predicted DNA-binding transcriptional regulator AlpA
MCLGGAEMNRYLSPQQVCEIIPGMTRGQLAQLRFTNTGPRYRKPTSKMVVYLESEVIAWIEDSARYGTAPGAVLRV